MKNKYLKWLLIGMFWIMIWQGLAMVVSSTLLLPTPIETLQALIRLLSDSTFYLDAGMTILRCMVAIVLALLFGLMLSILAYKNRLIRDVLALPVAFFKAVPIMAVAIYLILLLTAGSVPIFVCFVMCFPIVYTNLLTGLDNMDKNLLEMAQIYNIKGMKLIRFIYLPSLYPYYKSAMSIVAGMSWKAIVTAEVLSIPKLSLGYQLMNSKYYLNTDSLFAYVLVIIAISVAFEKLIKGDGGKRAKIVYKNGTKKTGVNVPNLNNRSDIAVKLDSIYKSFDDKEVLKNFSMELIHGSKTACMGASGSGKTTLIRIIAGLEKPDSGKVTVNANRIAVIFQEDRLLPWLNVYDNLAIVNNDKSRIVELLRAVGLEEDADKLPSELSGGMKFRLSMARAFIYDADLLLADEPFQGLDADTRKFVIENLWKTGVIGKTVLLITHSEDEMSLVDKTFKIPANN